MARIGFLGGGRMAQAMVRRLLAAGHQVTVYNRTVEKIVALEREGAKIASTPRESVVNADVIFSSVTDVAASKAVWTGPHGALSGDIAKGVLIVEHSTLLYEWVIELNDIVRQHGLRYVDCPVAGRPDAAIAGQLIAFVGAAQNDWDDIAPLVSLISRRQFHFGPPGTATAFKLIYNVLGVTQIVGLAEAMSAAEAAGINLKTAASAFAEGNTGSGHVIRHAAFMSENTHEDPPSFSAANRLKDLAYGLALEDWLGEDPRLGRAAEAVYKSMAASGMSEAADSMVIDAVRLQRKPKAS